MNSVLGAGPVFSSFAKYKASYFSSSLAFLFPFQLSTVFENDVNNLFQISFSTVFR